MMNVYAAKVPWAECNWPLRSLWAVLCYYLVLVGMVVSRQVGTAIWNEIGVFRQGESRGCGN